MKSILKHQRNNHTKPYQGGFHEDNFVQNLCFRTIFYVLIITFYIYQTTHSFPNKLKSLPFKLRKYFKYNSEDKAV